MQLVDYRELHVDQPFDKIASVGMFEHVGRAQMGRYFNTVARLLRPGGLVLNHGITAGAWTTRSWAPAWATSSTSTSSRVVSYCL